MTRDYWERNIAGFSRVYADQLSAERFDRPRWLTALYRMTVMRLERRLMAERYRLVVAFLDRAVRPGMVVADVGCGNGVFVVEALRRGATVIALDYAESALRLTREYVSASVPERAGDVQYLHADIMDTPAPKADVALAIGVTPYIADLGVFVRHVLAPAVRGYFLWLDATHWANRTRRLLPAINVRDMRAYRAREVERQYVGLQRIRRDRIGTGWLDEVVQSGHTGP